MSLYKKSRKYFIHLVKVFYKLTNIFAKKAFHDEFPFRAKQSMVILLEQPRPTHFRNTQHSCRGTCSRSSSLNLLTSVLYWVITEKNNRYRDISENRNRYRRRYSENRKYRKPTLKNEKNFFFGFLNY